MSSWCWCRLGSLVNYGECKNAEVKDIPPDAWVLDLEEIEKGTGQFVRLLRHLGVIRADQLLENGGCGRTLEQIGIPFDAVVFIVVDAERAQDLPPIIRIRLVQSDGLRHVQELLAQVVAALLHVLVGAAVLGPLLEIGAFVTLGVELDDLVADKADVALAAVFPLSDQAASVDHLRNGLRLVRKNVSPRRVELPPVLLVQAGVEVEIHVAAAHIVRSFLWY